MKMETQRKESFMICLHLLARLFNMVSWRVKCVKVFNLKTTGADLIDKFSDLKCAN